MANLIETQRVYKILKIVTKKLNGGNTYADKWYQVYHYDGKYTIISNKDQNKFMTLEHSERSVSWVVPKGVSVLSIQQAVL